MSKTNEINLAKPEDFMRMARKKSFSRQALTNYVSDTIDLWIIKTNSIGLINNENRKRSVPLLEGLVPIVIFNENDLTFSVQRISAAKELAKYNNVVNVMELGRFLAH